jgi:hypothetical protein
MATKIIEACPSCDDARITCFEESPGQTFWTASGWLDSSGNEMRILFCPFCGDPLEFDDNDG